MPRDHKNSEGIKSITFLKLTPITQLCHLKNRNLQRGICNDKILPGTHLFLTQPTNIVVKKANTANILTYSNPWFSILKRSTPSANFCGPQISPWVCKSICNGGPQISPESNFHESSLQIRASSNKMLHLSDPGPARMERSVDANLDKDSKNRTDMNGVFVVYECLWYCLRPCLLHLPTGSPGNVQTKQLSCRNPL